MYTTVCDAVRACAPIAEIAKLFPQSFPVTQQNAILSSVFDDEVMLKYPPPSAYLQRFLKAFVTFVEKLHEEMSERLMELYFYSMNTVQDSDRYESTVPAYRSYTVMGRTFSIRVTNSYKLVGLTLWDAGFYLTEYALCHMDEFKGKKIVELGAGCGLTGVGVCMTDLDQIVLTDYAPPVLLNLKEAITINEDIVKGRAIVRPCDWFAMNQEIVEALRCDFIIAADCVWLLVSLDTYSHFHMYDIELTTQFIAALDLLLHDNLSRYALVAQSRRSDEIFAHFYERATFHRLHVEDLTGTVDMLDLFTYNKEPQRLFRIRAKTSEEEQISRAS